jgi:hypothetical protein
MNNIADTYLTAIFDPARTLVTSSQLRGGNRVIVTSWGAHDV